MGITTKIMLALVIVAGLAGIVLGVSYVPGKIQEKIEAEKKVGDDKVGKANTELSAEKTKYAQAASELSTTKSELTTATADKAKLKSDFDALNLGSTDAARQVIDSNKKAGDAVKARDDAQKQLAEYQGYKKAAEEFQALGVPVDDIKKQLEELKTLKGTVAANKGGKMVQGLVGMIRNVDPKLGFITIDIGASKGAKQGGLMTVTRNGQFIGQIKVRTVTPNLSIADVVKEMTKIELKEGDTVAVTNF